MSRLRRSLALAALALPVGCAAVATPAVAGPVTPVPKLDVQRYLGEWRQIASKPQWFEALCQRNTFANYALNPDGTVAVSNRCTGPFNSNVYVRGRARVLDTTTNAQLQVSFVPGIGGGTYYPDRKPNYIVIGLGEAYDWAIVGDPDRTSAFVLSRAPTLTPAQTATVKTILDANGFDPCRLITTRQAGGLQVATSFCKV